MALRRSGGWALRASAALAASAVLAAGCGGGDGSPGATAATSAPAPAAGPGDPSAAFERAASLALPSVVQINSSSSLGSGIVFDAQGDVVTNAHVVEGARSFEVVTSDGRRHGATLRGAFPPGDLAVVRLRDGGNGLKPARFADSSKLRVGQAVLAVGSPLGLRSSVTNGIVSAVSRTVSEGNGVAPPSVVQTSAAINPGNSGGALVDMSGAVVGIPTLAATDPQLGGGAAPGVGFAISSNTVRRIGSQLSAHGAVTASGRAYLGVELQSVPSGGALVAGVQSRGPAAKAGIRAGDVIIKVAGRPVQTVDDVAVALADHRPGDRIGVEVTRQDGSTGTVQVTVGELPGSG
jgi:S1-C subfamily serine protease